MNIIKHTIAVSCLLFTQPLLADEKLKLDPGADPSTPAFEIVVTADAVNQDLTTPFANRTEIKAPQLSEQHDMHFADVIDAVPNLNFSGGTSRPRFFQVRGIGELEQYEGAPNSSVGFLVDDFDLSSLGSAGTLFDVEEVKVLRGPQGFGFGPSALAGLIQLKTRDPSPQLTSRAEITAAEDSLYSGSAALGGPLSEDSKNIQFRLAVSSDHSDGFRTNDFLGRDDTNHRDEFTGRAKIRILAAPAVTIDLQALHIDLDNGYDVFTIDNTFHTQSDRPGVDKQETDGLAAKFSLDLGNRINLVNTSTVTDSDTEYSYDGDWANNILWGFNAPYDYFSFTTREQRVYSNEIRVLTRRDSDVPGEEFNWLFGLYQERLAEDSDNLEFSNDLVFDSLQSEYVAKHNALFGALEVPMAERTSFTVGARAENRASEYSDSQLADFAPDENLYGALIGINHQLESGTQTYLSASRGYKGGGFNTGANVPRDRLTFGPEYLWNFELGVNDTLLGGALSLNSALFYSLRREQQVKLALQDNPEDPLSFTYVTDNAAAGHNLGAELEADWGVTDRLHFLISGALLSAKFDTINAPDRALEGRDQAHAPNWQFATGVKYDFTDNIFARVDVTGKDAFYFDNSHDQRSSAYALTGAAIGYQSKNWSWTVWAHNLFDQRYAVRGFYFGVEPPDFPNKLYTQLGDPRQIGTTISFYF